MEEYEFDSQRIVRVVGEDGQSRIMDISELSDYRYVYGKIFQKFNIIRDRNDLASVEKELERWILLQSNGNDEDGNRELKCVCHFL